MRLNFVGDTWKHFLRHRHKIFLLRLCAAVITTVHEGVAAGSALPGRFSLMETGLPYVTVKCHVKLQELNARRG